MLNQAIIVGRLVDDVVFENNTGKAKIAVPRSFKNENGEYDTDFLPVLLTGTIANNTADYCQKGDLVGIKGRLQVEDDKIVIIAEKVTFLSSKNKKNEEEE